MKIVIIGCGKVGETLADQLAHENHDIVLVDKNAAVLQSALNRMDVLALHGNGANMAVQREAGVANSDLLIAVTPHDEVNLLCCILARKLGCIHTIARIRNPEYDEQLTALSDDLGLSMTINPERAAALEIYRILQFPSFLKRDAFYESHVELVEIQLTSDSPLASLRIDQLPMQLKSSILICAVDCNNVITIPKGSFQLLAGDKITVLASAADLVKLFLPLGLKQRHIQAVLIVGGGRIAEYLTHSLLEARAVVKIIEQDPQRCLQLAEALPDALIIQGDGTAQDLLVSEGVGKMDAVVSLTGLDEENIILSLSAKHMGVPKTITKVNRSAYADLFSDRGLDSIISPKQITANVIVRFVRSLASSGQGSIQTLHRIVGGKVEALEFIATDATKHLSMPLSKLPLKSNILLACINRGGTVITPKGADTIEAGDRVIVITAATSGAPILSLNDIYKD